MFHEYNIMDYKLIYPLLYMKKVLLILVLCYSQVITYAQADSIHYSKLTVTLHDAPFSSLALLDYTDGRHLIFEAKLIDQYSWEIWLPDSLQRQAGDYFLIVPPNDGLQDTLTTVRFIVRQEGGETFVSNVGLDGKLNHIRGKYKDQSVYVGNQVEVCEDFELIIEDPQADIAVRAQDPYYAWFMLHYGSQERPSYEEYLQSYIAIAEKHPDSYYLISNLSKNLVNFRNRDDVRMIAQHFSDKHAETRWVARISRFLGGQFENLHLPVSVNGVREPIIMEPSKYHLIVLSASWCVPCIEEIPLLKEIYQDLNEKMEIVTVSIDNKKDIPAFERLIVQHEIPWRTVYGYAHISDVEDYYFVNTIPHTILVNPTGSMQILDVRNDSARKKMYQEVLKDN